MPDREARIFAEGSLRWVIASATGHTWQTASAPLTGLVGYVQAGLTFTRNRNVISVMERGIPDHFKQASKAAVDVQFTFLQAVTANMPPTAITAAGASLPLLHMELKHNAVEAGGPTAQYHQFICGAFVSDPFTEAEDGNKYQQTWRFLELQGPVHTGYLSTGQQNP